MKAWRPCGPLNAGRMQRRFLHQSEAHPHHEVIRALCRAEVSHARHDVQRDISVYADEQLRRLAAIDAATPPLDAA